MHVVTVASSVLGVVPSSTNVVAARYPHVPARLGVLPYDLLNIAAYRQQIGGEPIHVRHGARKIYPSVEAFRVRGVPDLG